MMFFLIKLGAFVFKRITCITFIVPVCNLQFCLPHVPVLVTHGKLQLSREARVLTLTQTIYTFIKKNDN